MGYAICIVSVDGTDKGESLSSFNERVLATVQASENLVKAVLALTNRLFVAWKVITPNENTPEKGKYKGGAISKTNA